MHVPNSEQRVQAEEPRKEGILVDAKQEVLALYVTVEMSKDIEQGKLEPFVTSVSESELTYLVKVLSQY